MGSRWVKSSEERFWEKVELIPFHTCWEWMGCKAKTGHGHFRVNGKTMGAYRFAYELLREKISDALHIDHLCRNPGCVNPAHMEPVTQRENTLRGIGIAAKNARKTHCKAGHIFDENNTYRRPMIGRYSYGTRDCRICKNIAQKRYIERKQ